MPVTEPIVASSIAQTLLAEFETQSLTTRRFLDRVPADKLTWKPHDKSMTAGQLALHIASWPGHIVHFVAENPVQARSESQFPQPSSHTDIIHAFDVSASIVRERLIRYNDTAMNEMWRLMAGDMEIFAIPRVGFLREVMFSHMYHHRGQLSVYLRLLDIPVPASYGPSADERPSFMQDAPGLTID